MAFNINRLVNDNGGRVSVIGEKFRTPRLPPVEELKLLRLWKAILEVGELEAEVAETYEISIYELFDEKRAEKECADFTFVSSLRNQLRLHAAPSVKGGSETKRAAIPKSSKTSLESETSKSGSTSSKIGFGKHNAYKRRYWTATRDFHPDEILLRFLVQQDWDVGKAFARMTINGLFFQKWDLDGIMLSGEEGAMATVKESKDRKAREVASSFLKQCQLGKTFVHGSDSEGRPIVTTRMRLNNVDEKNTESNKKFILWQLECGRLMLGPSVTDVVAIWDFTGATYENVNLSATKFGIDILHKHFPGAFTLLIFHNCSKFLEKSWDVVIKGWFQPKSRERVKFTRSALELEQYIPREYITKELGGDDPWKFEYIPVQPGENDIMKNKELEKSVWEEYEALWNMCDNYTRTMIDMASKGTDYSEVKRRRNDLAVYMRVAYWKLDPFIRARSYYDRAGDIGFRRESAFMALMLTRGREIDYNTIRLDEMASRNSEEEEAGAGNISDMEEEDDPEGDDEDEDEDDE